jgi:hypothetical protein
MRVAIRRNLAVGRDAAVAPGGVLRAAITREAPCFGIAIVPISAMPRNPVVSDGAGATQGPFSSLYLADTDWHHQAWHRFDTGNN